MQEKPIPVIALSAQGFEKNSGFKINYKVVKRAMQALIYGDVFMRCLYRTRPYEKEKGSANALHEKWKKICLESPTVQIQPHKIHSRKQIMFSMGHHGGIHHAQCRIRQKTGFHEFLY